MNVSIRRGAFFGAIIFALAAMTATDLGAQQTVFTTPSAEVNPDGRVVLDLTTTFRPFDTNRYSAWFPRVTVGVGNGVELTSGVLDTEGSLFGNTTALTVGGKWRFYANEASGTSLTAMSQANVPLRGPLTKGSVLAFSGIHQEVRPTGTRLSGGIFNATPHALRSTNLIGGWASLEQPFGSRVSLIADWMSGNHRLGYLTPGVSISSRHHTVKAGYQIANAHGRNNGFTLRYVVNF